LRCAVVVLLPLVAVSAFECVDALRVAGFFVRAHSAATGYSLSNGLRSVTVRSTVLLAPDELLAILRDAGIPYCDFLDLLSEAPTDPAIVLPPRPPARAASGR